MNGKKHLYICLDYNHYIIYFIGTAKQFVTHDYGEKLFDGLKASRNLLKNAAQYVLLQDRSFFHRKFLESDFERPDYGSRSKPLALDLKNGAQHIVAINRYVNRIIYCTVDLL